MISNTGEKNKKKEERKEEEEKLRKHSRRLRRATVVLVLILLVVSGCVAQFGGTPNVGFASAAAVLTVVTLVAVGIERVIEIGWTIVGQMSHLGAWWPADEVTNRGKKLEGELNDQLSELVKQFDSSLVDGGKLIDEAEDKADDASKWIVGAMRQFEYLQKQAPGSQRVNMIAANAQSALNQANLALSKPGLDKTLKTADQAIDSLLEFVATFKENPARRLISLYAGMLLGLVVAFILRLDVFCAASGADSCIVHGLALNPPLAIWKLSPITAFLPTWSIALTGLLIGLGSNPTHEVIRYIQESKKSQKALNGPNVITTIEEIETGEPTDAELKEKVFRPRSRTTRTLFLR